MVKDIAGMIVMFIVVLCLGAFLTAIPVKLLWNWLMPSIFGLRSINFAEALGLCFLCSCLFGSKNVSAKKE